MSDRLGAQMALLDALGLKPEENGMLLMEVDVYIRPGKYPRVLATYELAIVTDPAKQELARIAKAFELKPKE